MQQTNFVLCKYIKYIFTARWPIFQKKYIFCHNARIRLQYGLGSIFGLPGGEAERIGQGTTE